MYSSISIINFIIFVIDILNGLLCEGWRREGVYSLDYSRNWFKVLYICAPQLTRHCFLQICLKVMSSEIVGRSFRCCNIT
jgi:hypothetical protein